MKVTERPSLKTLNTFGAEASAGLMITLENEEDVLTLPRYDAAKDLVLGGGSNLLLASDVSGTVFLNRIRGRAIVKTDPDYCWIDAGAGENWHELVRWSLENDLSGLENLSLIPGLAGAAPIQNIGAYGVELASVLDSVTAWDLVNNRWILFSNEECRLGYRDSYFKSVEPDRFLITSIRLRLNRVFQPRLNYSGLSDELANIETGSASATDVSNAVMRLRLRKLPDPSRFGNAGSFFKNPVMNESDASELKNRFKELPCWKLDDHSVKLSAAWLIESCGLKGLRQGDAGVSEQHALVLVNYGKASGREIYQLARDIQVAVREKFGIQLEPEPKILQ